MDTFGPQLSDYDFFKKVLNISKINIKGFEEAVYNNEFKSARKLFAEYIRKSLRPDLFLKIPYFAGDNIFILPGESIEEAAERILEKKLVSVGILHQFNDEVDWFLNPTYNQYKEWTWQLSRHNEFKLLAYRYLLTKDERYAKCFTELFESWVKQAVVPENEKGYETLAWRTIEAGIRTNFNWPYALHAFYMSPYFTDDLLIDWYKSVWEHGFRLRNFHMTGNWLIMEMSGLANISIIYPIFNDSDEWLQYSYAKLYDELYRQVYPDGFQFELTTNYQQVVIENYAHIMKIAKLYGIKEFDKFMPIIEMLEELYLKIVMPDFHLPDINDGCNKNVSKLIDTTIEMFPDRDDFKWLHTEGKEGSAPEFTSNVLKYSGIAVMRTAWDRNSIWALFDGGPFGAGHQHEDKLNLLIYAYGKLLLTEGGNYAYDSSEMRKYVSSSRAHNVIRIDDCDQNRRYNFSWHNDDINKLSDIKWCSTKNYDVSEGCYDEGYGRDAALKVKHIRKVIFIKSCNENESYFIVVDRLYPQDNEKHSYDVLWHFYSESYETSGLKVISGEEGNPCITVQTADIDDLTLKIVCCNDEPEKFQGWKSLNFIQNQYLPAPTAVYNLNVMGDIRIVTILYPSKNNQCPLINVEANSSVDDNNINLIFADGKTIKYDENDFPINSAGCKDKCYPV